MRKRRLDMVPIHITLHRDQMALLEQFARDNELTTVSATIRFVVAAYLWQRLGKTMPAIKPDPKTQLQVG